MTHRRIIAATTLAVLASLAPTPALAGSTETASPGSLSHRQAGRASLEVKTHRVAAGSRIALAGTTPGSRRPVVLQRRTSKGWVAVARTKTSRTGRFHTKVRARKAMTLRSVAPARRGLRLAKSRAVSVRAVAQSGTLVAIPPLSAPGTTPGAPAATAQVVATFTPPLPGGPVLIQKQTSDGWITEGRAAQNRSGGATFDVAPGETYRALSGEGSRAPRTAAVQARQFPILFADDFDAAGTDGRSPSVWTDQFRPAVPGRTCATLSPALRNVADGVLHLAVAPDPLNPAPCSYTDKSVSGTSDHVLNTQVATVKTFTFTHGYAAARMKMPANPGAHTGFWLLPAKTVPDGLPDWHDVGFTADDPSQGAEIDVVEYWAKQRRNGGEAPIGSFLHWYTTGGRDRLGGMYPQASKMKAEDQTWDNSFHVFAVRWTPTSYEFMVDGHVYATERRAVSQAPQYLVLSMLSSDYELARATPALYADSAQVDWVRVWGL